MKRVGSLSLIVLVVLPLIILLVIFRGKIVNYLEYTMDGLFGMDSADAVPNDPYSEPGPPPQEPPTEEPP